MTLEEALKEIERRDEIINSYKTILAIERENYADLLGKNEALTCQIVDLKYLYNP